ncbi:zinc finger protein 862-like [Saccostrea echinata]|uniref:zinc finger protein 862-like n=1 Tax=Saccostrea echinata TaxID=191078 RepID=UPI002A83D63D|nr:zinc finger protein 862-like [Saccostrea echinata]
MQGKKNGVAGKLMKDYSHLISVWCIAHKLQLSVMDAVKDVDILHRLEATLKGIYKYYHGSPKRRREVKAVAEVLEADLAHIPDLKEVRWVASQSKALQAIKTNLLVITTHLGEAASRSDVYAGSAKKYLKDLCSSSVLKTMFLLLDILGVIADLSKFFQTEDLLILEVLPKMEAACLRLTSLKYHPGENMQEFLGKYSPDTGYFGDVKLTGPCPEVDFKDKSTQHILDKTIAFLDERFSVFKESPVKDMNLVFNFKTWPLDRETLCVYGMKSLDTILNYFNPIFEQERDNIHTEYQNLKAYMAPYKTMPIYDAYLSLVQTGVPSLRNIVKVVELMLCLSCSTAKCERVFSSLKLLKTRLRSSLTQDNLNSQLQIMVEGPSLAEFKPDLAIEKWLNSTSDGKGRHINGHKFECTKDVNIDECEELLYQTVEK